MAKLTPNQEAKERLLYDGLTKAEYDALPLNFLKTFYDTKDFDNLLWRKSPILKSIKKVRGKTYSWAPPAKSIKKKKK